MATNTKRDTEILKRYLKGETLDAIGAVYGISKERVRKIVTKLNVSNLPGGKSLTASIKAATKAAAKTIDKFRSTYGCYDSERYRIDNSGNYDPKPSFRYAHQRQNSKKRNIPWQITFPEWWSVWQASGLYHLRGKGTGYCMTRFGDVGPYSVSNVEIKTIGENFSEANTGIHRAASIPNVTHCKNGHARTPDNLSQGMCKICKNDAEKLRRALKKMLIKSI